MKKRYLLPLLMVVCFCPMIAKADCSNERLVELNKIATNVKINYKYKFVDNSPIFTVTMTNLTNDIYIKDNIFATKFAGTGEKSMEYSHGQSIVFTIYSNDKNCPDKEIYTQYISIPKFNYYSTDERCEKYQKFKYCKTWLDTSSIEYKTFNSEFEKYIKGPESKDTKDSADKNMGFWDAFKQIVNENKVIIGISLTGVIVLGVYIFFRIKNRKKDKLI